MGWIVGKLNSQHSGHIAASQSVKYTTAAERKTLAKQMEVGLTATQAALLNAVNPEDCLPRSLLNSLKVKAVNANRGGLDPAQALVRDLRALAAKGKAKYYLLYSRDQSLSGDFSAQMASAQTVHTGMDPSSESRILMGIAWTTAAFQDKAARYPEVMSLDATCKTNDERRPFYKLQGCDGEGNTFPMMNALLWDESLHAMNWMLLEAMPYLLPDSVRHSTTVILTDGDPYECLAVDSAITLGFLPNAKRKRCWWHACHQAMVAEFGLGSWDLPVLRCIRGWLNHLAFRVETPEQFGISLRTLLDWIKNNCDTSILHKLKKNQQIQESKVDALQNFVIKLAGLAKYWARCYRTGLRDIGHITTALSEAANSLIKRGKLINQSTGMVRERVDKLEEIGRQNHAVTADYHINAELLPNKKCDDAVLKISREITAHALERFVIPEHNAHVNYVVLRVTETTWRVYLRERDT